MNITVTEIGTSRILEVQPGFIFKETGDIMDLVGSAMGHSASKVIILEQQLPPVFFNLRSGVAGEFLQKFVNYRIRVAIVGNFDKFNSKALKDFIFESNKGKQVYFAANMEDARQNWHNK
ncbi:DUF4180 domain-containing protein [Chitinophaga horti]|uniref:DUF4180 domain-containing protein n=1 Tax=Chitinophaga horti TaxID=2920382 RepID=A0ABY6J8F4_9BACT|nr:DUF4180 domain-containing protein [Chitinophaga horti]UYQ95944.1 DUF4180 domain-containing protein [Chitinophaga horti]